MSNKKFILGLVALGVLGFALVQAPSSLNLGSSSITRTYSSTSVSTTTVGTGITQVVAANPNRIFLMIANNSSFIPLFCSLDGSVTTTASRVSSTAGATLGFQIGVNSSTATSYHSAVYENSGYTGIVNCTASANASVTIITAQ